MAASKQPILLFFVFYLNKAVIYIILSDLIYISKDSAMNEYFKYLFFFNNFGSINGQKLILNQEIYYN